MGNEISGDWSVICLHTSMDCGKTFVLKKHFVSFLDLRPSWDVISDPHALATPTAATGNITNEPNSPTSNNFHVHGNPCTSTRGRI